MVKVCAIGDPHGKLPFGLSKIIKRNKIEIIICVGDFAFTPEKPWLEKSWKGIGERFMNKNYEDVIGKLCSYKLPVLTLRGNMFIGDKKKIADRILGKYENLISKFTGKIKLSGKNFIFFDVSFENSTIIKGDKQKTFFKNRMRKNKSRERKLNKLLKENNNSILICHNPPYGIVDKAYDGNSVGSKIIRKAIEKYPPKIIFCGHIHEAKGKGKIGKTEIYNLGWHGDYLVLDTTKNKIIESNFLR